MATKRDLIEKGAEPRPEDLLLELDRKISSAGGRLDLDYGGTFGPSVENLRVRSLQKHELAEDSLFDMAKLAQIAIEFRGPIAVALIWSITRVIIRIIDLFDGSVIVRMNGKEIVISRPKERASPSDVLAIVRELRQQAQPKEEVVRASPRRLHTVLKNLIGTRAAPPNADE
jgi:hypothetical protein